MKIVVLLFAFVGLAFAEIQILTKTNPCTFATLTLTSNAKSLLYKYRDTFVIEATVNINTTRTLKISITADYAVSTYDGINPSQDFYNKIDSQYYGSYRLVKNKLSKEINPNLKYYINICADFETSESEVVVMYDYDYTFVHKTEFNTKNLGWIVPLCLAGFAAIILACIHIHGILKSKFGEPINNFLDVYKKPQDPTEVIMY